MAESKLREHHIFLYLNQDSIRRISCQGRFAKVVGSDWIQYISLVLCHPQKKKRVCRYSTESGRLFIKIKNSKGPRTLPWGTPE